ncbi:hypothetical protein Tco_0575392 [Tanacetum coccineum]
MGMLSFIRYWTSYYYSPIHYGLNCKVLLSMHLILTILATAKSKAVNNVKQIHATIDGKTVVISESSVKSDLHFNDEDGITCLSNDEIFVNLALMGGPPKKVGDDAVHTGEDDRVVRADTTATSLEAEKDSGAKIPHWGMQIGTVYSLKDKNQAKTNKTEHGMEKREKVKVKFKVNLAKSKTKPKPKNT